METSYINCYEVLTYSYKTIITNISSPTTATIFSTQKLPYIGVYRIPLFWTDPNDVSFFFMERSPVHAYNGHVLGYGPLLESHR